jgi:hypothetical protein
VKCSLESWANIISGSSTLSECLKDQSVVIDGDAPTVIEALQAFDIAGLCA